MKEIGEEPYEKRMEYIAFLLKINNYKKLIKSNSEDEVIKILNLSTSELERIRETIIPDVNKVPKNESRFERKQIGGVTVKVAKELDSTSKFIMIEAVAKLVKAQVPKWKIMEELALTEEKWNECEIALKDIINRETKSAKIEELIKLEWKYKDIAKELDVAIGTVYTIAKLRGLTGLKKERGKAYILKKFNVLKRSEIQNDLGITESTFYSWLNELKKEGKL